LAGQQIPLSARIVAVVDVFDALLSKRPYKEPWSLAQTMEYIQSRSGSQFDPHVVQALNRLVTESRLPYEL
ncbi:HD-GYP domain-containing protein, partial [Aeromonas salmonicida]|nr:phosphodiesterase [Aeromonas salmonicida]